MSGDKTTNVTIQSNGGAISIGGDANVGSVLDASTSGNARQELAASAESVAPFDVFISYAHPDRAAAEAIAAALTQAGYSVWFDRELLAGDQFVRAINARLEAARFVLVIWSARAVVSDWVLNEAETARRRGSLLAVSLDGVAPPAPFTLTHTPYITDAERPTNNGLESVLRRLASGG